MAEIGSAICLTICNNVTDVLKEPFVALKTAKFDSAKGCNCGAAEDFAQLKMDQTFPAERFGQIRSIHT